ncbi:hypothetical protein GGQ87_001990 [Brevundimonas alba]|uniref:Uncharacterized protein n=1 Tax=Brevundimonas alba TaxID=74314 RepID=A0A7X5YLB5_9CAUL|nr:hypothetical protein [Brevundimonas alba]NJC41732.1 hypothetical protein [Brevundimonas alba]
MTFRFEDAYPTSPAFGELPALRIPSGWRIEWNSLRSSMEGDLATIGGSTIYNATNVGTRFNIDVTFEPEFDPEGSFFLRVAYAPWPRSERGRRMKEQPLSFLDAVVVHSFHTRSYAALVAELEHWIARCTVWTREGS